MRWPVTVIVRARNNYCERQKFAMGKINSVSRVLKICTEGGVAKDLCLLPERNEIEDVFLLPYGVD